MNTLGYVFIDTNHTKYMAKSVTSNKNKML